MNNLVMAWRNLWRNKRRTLITVSSVFFGVLLSTLMSSIQEGTYSNMIDNVVKSYTGYIQVHQPDYWENKSINNTFEQDGKLLQKLGEIENIQQVIPRLESFALMSSGEKTKGGMLVGIDPEKEEQLSKVSKWVEQGNYLKPDDSGVLITFNLAKHLNISVGDTLILLSQGYHGASAAGLYPVRGIIKFPSPVMNNLGIYMELSRAQEFFSAPGRLTSLALLADDYIHVDKIMATLKKRLGIGYSAMSWKEISPELVQFIDSDRDSSLVMKGILYMIIAFGILGTIIMMVAERKRELGVMVAVGMQRYKLSKILLYETVLIGIVGVIAGFIVSVPMIYYFVSHPIPLADSMAEAYIQYGIEPVWHFSMNPEVFGNQVLTVLVFTLLISLYPYFTIRKLRVIQALRA